MAVKLYEKDPSKLTAMDEPRPNLATNSDISDDEESSNQAVDVDVKEEPVDVVSVDENPPPLVPDSQAVFAATAFPTPHLRERHSFSSGQDEPSTDSDTVRQRKKILAVDIHTTVLLQDSGHASRQAHMKTLPSANFVERSKSQSPPQSYQQPPIQLLQQQSFGCHICRAVLPSQAAFHQVSFSNTTQLMPDVLTLF